MKTNCNLSAQEAAALYDTKDMLFPLTAGELDQEEIYNHITKELFGQEKADQLKETDEQLKEAELNLTLTISSKSTALMVTDKLNEPIWHYALGDQPANRIDQVLKDLAIIIKTEKENRWQG